MKAKKSVRDRLRLDAIRRRATPIENHIIDEYAAGKITRRDFIRRGTIIGMSVSVLGFVATACATDEGATTTLAGGPTTTGGSGTTGGPTTTGATGTSGSTGAGAIRAAMITPAGAIDPVLTNDEGRLAILGQTGQYLAFSDAELNLIPVLAESWEPNETLDVWTFNLRQGVTYHDGSPMVADDVVAVFTNIASGNAASAYETFGVTPENIVAIDEATVEFTLAQPNGSFPFFVSSDNYNGIIVPASFWDSYAEGSYETEFPGTGIWQIENHEPGVSASFVKNQNYWGDNAAQPEQLEVTFFADEAVAVTAFQEGRVDVIPHISSSGGQALLESPDATVASIPTAQHRQVYFDTSAPPFNDKRVRQAVALTLNRQVLIDGLLAGFGTVGNDHPIWEFFPMFSQDTPAQRTEDLAAAQGLLDAAGLGAFEAPLHTLVFAEVEDLAQLIAASAAQVGITLNLGVFDSGTYYNDYWLAAAGSMGIVNYGHRGVPNVYLAAPLLSDGTWNASHWVNETYDDLYNQFASAPDLDIQRQLSGELQTLLNDEVPFIVPYFVDHISITQPNFSGLVVTGMGHVDLVNASVS
ncbi:MAG: ABC transporter substrate-binding protein [Acidimicrobiia bacterium]|nr:ABC transporter substrate-binding protein [Acidimicrobiia bacterium]